MARAVRTAATAATVLLGPMAPAADFLTLVTTQMPPLSVISADDKISGTATDMLTNALSQAGIRYSIASYPWARALAVARAEPGTCVYPTVRSPEREGRFKWIGPIGTGFSALFAHAGAGIPASLDEVKTHPIGIVLGDVNVAYLRDKGFKIDESRDDALNLRKLQTGRIDYWLTDLSSGQFRIRQADAEDVIPVFIFRETAIYLACNPSVSDDIVEKLTDLLSRASLKP